MITLRPYQQECIRSIPERGAYLIQLATGLGKTVIFTQMPRRGRMLIISHREELVRQPLKYFDCKTGVEMAGEHAPADAEVVSASVQSLVRRLDRYAPDAFDVVVVDECFPGTVKVDGKPLNSIKNGDIIASWNSQTGQIEYKPVTHVFKRKPSEMCVVILENGQFIPCTPNHPFYVEGVGYVPAIKLQEGFCVKRAGQKEGVLFEHIRVARVEVREQTGDGTFGGLCPDGFVYNLEVEGNHNYFVDGILVHNCHHASANTYKRILKHFTPRLLLGFTATPNRADHVRLDDVFEKIIFQRDLRWGVQNGWLSDIFCRRVTIGYDLSAVKTRGGDFAPGELDEALDGTEQAVADAYRQYAEGATLIFAASVRHAQAIAAEIGPDAVVVTGETKNRADIIRDFTERKIKCLVNVMVFTEGTDIPLIETLIIARPTQSDSLYTQMVGRGLRLHPDKQRLNLIDCVGVTGSRHLCSAPSLLGISLDDIPAKQRERIQGDLFDLPDLAAEAADRPESWIRNVKIVDLWAKSNSYNLHDVAWFKMPDGSLRLSKPRMTITAPDELGNVLFDGREMPAQEAYDAAYRILTAENTDSKQLWDKNAVKRWGAAPATEKQKNMITARCRKKYPDIDVNSLTKGEAAMILNRILTR